MGGQDILFINNNPDLSKLFQKTFEKTGAGLTSIPNTKDLDPQLTKNNYTMIILESKKGIQEDLNAILNKNPSKELFLIVGSSDLIKSGMGKIHELSGELKKEPGKNHSQPSATNGSRDLMLNDFVEKKLKDFVKRMAWNKGRNLHSLMIKEIEKPLITLILNETKGNQVQAAQILGLNRNTLRKKIKELKINIKKTKR